MLRLVSPDKVRSRLGLGPAAATNPFLLGAIDAAQTRIASELDSQLEHALHVDQFMLDRRIQGAQVNGLWRLRLSTGLLTDDVVTVTNGLTFNDSLPETVDSALIKIDRLKGLVWIDASVGGYIQVSYTAGFADADVPTNIPLWLTEAILGYVPLVMNFSQIQDRPADLKTLTTLNVQHALACIGPKQRPMGGLLPF